MKGKKEDVKLPLDTRTIRGMGAPLIAPLFIREMLQRQLSVRQRKECFGKRETYFVPVLPKQWSYS